MHLLIALGLWASLSFSPDRPCPETSRDATITSIEFQGLDTTRPHVVSRALLHTPGAPFLCSQWESELTSLQNLDIFASIELDVTPQPQGLHLTYTFKELPKFFLFPALKATDQNGWGGGPGVSILNLFGRDIRVDFYIRTSLFPDPLLATEYMLYSESLWIGDLPLEWLFQVIHQDSYNPQSQFTEDSILFDLDVYHRSPLPFKVLYTASLFTLAHDPGATHFTPGDGTTHRLFLSPDDREVVPKLGVGLVFDNREKLFNPHQGLFQELRVSQFGGVLGGSSNYREALTDTRLYIPLRKRDTLLVSLLGRYRPGVMGAYDFLYAGGSNTLRTQGLKSAHYAQHEFIANLEYRAEFFERHQFHLWGSDLFYGLQWVFGVDAVTQWRSERGRPRELVSLYMGPHLLFPGFDRFRIEFGINNLEAGWSRTRFGVSLGLFEKTFNQRQRIR